MNRAPAVEPAVGAASVDREARRRLVQLIRAKLFSDGKGFSHDVQELVAGTRDRAVRGIVEMIGERAEDRFGVCHPLIDEMMTGMSAGRPGVDWPRRHSGAHRRARRVVARMIIFLRTDLPYSWHCGDDPIRWSSRLFFVALGALLVLPGPVLLLNGLYQSAWKEPLIDWRFAFTPWILCLGLFGQLVLWSEILHVVDSWFRRPIRRWKGRVDPYYDVWPFADVTQMGQVLPKRIGGGGP